MTVDATVELLGLLAVSGSSGALEISDTVSGTVYLQEGRIGFAEASAVPGAGARLVRRGVIGEKDWRAADLVTGPPGPYSQAARSTLLADPSARDLVRSAVVDAVAALMSGSDRGARRFHADRRHWLADSDGVELDVLLRWIATARAAAEPVEATDVPSLGPAAAPLTVAAVDWWLPAAVDGEASVAELAAEAGAAVLGARAGVARLVAAGVCRVRRAPPGVRPVSAPVVPSDAAPVTPVPPSRTEAPVRPRPVPAPVVRARETGAPGVRRRPSSGLVPATPTEPEILPRRRRGAHLADEPAPPRAPVVRPGRYAGPRDPALLRRLLDGLRGLE